MREYGKVFPQFWTGDTGRQLKSLGQECQLLAIYLATGPSANMIGIYHLPIAMICCHIGRPLPSPLVSPLPSPFEAAAEALRRVCETGFATYDETSEMIFVPRMAEFQVGRELKAGDNRIKNITKQLEAVRKCRFVKDFYAIYGGAYNLPPLATLEAPSKPLGKPPPHPLRSQEQEQEQEQETPPKSPKGETGNLELPAILDTAVFRERLAEWFEYKGPKAYSKSISRKSLITRMANVAKERGVEFVADAIQRAIANTYKGWELKDWEAKGNGPQPAANGKRHQPMPPMRRPIA